MKMLVVAFALLGFTLSESKAYTDDKFTGFYFGAHTGYGSTTGNMTSQKTYGVGHAHYGSANIINGSLDVGSNNHQVGLLGGYGLVIQNAYLGAELGYTQSNDRITSTLGNNMMDGKTDIELKRNGYFSLGLRVGALLTDTTMIFAKLALNHGRWTLKDNLTGNFNLTNPGYKNSIQDNFAPGFGFEAAFEEMLVRFEYSYEFGKSMKAVSNTTELYSINSFSSIGKIRTQSAKVGLSYKF